MPNFIEIGRGDIAIFRFFNTAAAAILNLQISKILLTNTVHRAEMYHCDKFRKNWSIHCRDIVIFRFFSRWQPFAILDWFEAYLDTHEQCLVVSITVQNLVMIDTVVV